MFDKTNYTKEYNKNRSNFNKTNGLCACCKGPAIPNKTRCEGCSKKRSEQNKYWRKKRKENELPDDDKGEYKMTKEERRRFNIRLTECFRQYPLQSSWNAEGQYGCHEGGRA